MSHFLITPETNTLSRRVNIIGEHVDYCGYSVLPMAVSQSIFLAVAENPDSSQLQLRNIEDAKFQGYDADLKTFRWVLLDV